MVASYNRQPWLQQKCGWPSWVGALVLMWLLQPYLQWYPKKVKQKWHMSICLSTSLPLAQFPWEVTATPGCASCNAHNSLHRDPHPCCWCSPLQKLCFPGLSHDYCTSFNLQSSTDTAFVIGFLSWVSLNLFFTSDVNFQPPPSYCPLLTPSINRESTWNHLYEKRWLLPLPVLVRGQPLHHSSIPSKDGLIKMGKD